MRHCPECGILRGYGRNFRWTPDGTIIARDPGRTRFAFLEVDELNALISGVSDHIGLPIDHIVFQAEKEVGRRFIDTRAPSLIARIPRTRLTRPRFAARLITRFVGYFMVGLGLGRAKMGTYRSAESTDLWLFDPYCVPLLVGDTAGMLEYFDHVTMDANWEELEDGSFHVKLWKSDDMFTAEERLTYEKPAYIQGQVKHDYFRRCNVPLAVTENLMWVMDKGIIKNKHTMVREVPVPAESFFAVFRELERELGHEVPALIEELEGKYRRERSVKYSSLQDVNEPSDLFTDFPWRGIGNPVKAARTEGGLEIILTSAIIM